MKALQAAIPGQSLTDEPRNFPWERPPEIVDPDEAIRFHIDRISKEDVIDNVFFALEFGVPVKNLTDSIMTGAVSEGIHSIDVSLIAAPIVRKFISQAAQTAGIEFKEEFEQDKTSPMDRASILVSAARATPKEERDAGFELIQEAGEAAQQEATQEQPEMEPSEEVPSKGLMSRV